MTLKLFEVVVDYFIFHFNKMEIEAFIKKMKDIYSPLIDFIDATDDQDAEFKALIDVLEMQEILENQNEIQLLFLLISKITDNHHQAPDFFNKLEKIFQFLIKDNPLPISYYIPDYTKYNKRILFLLLEKGFVKPDETFLNKYLKNKNDNKNFSPFGRNSIFSQRKPVDPKFSNSWGIKTPYMTQTFYYLYPKIKEYLEELTQKQIEEEISQKYKEELSTFKKSAN